MTIDKIKESHEYVMALTPEQQRLVDKLLGLIQLLDSRVTRLETPSPDKPLRYRHKKTGNTYTHLGDAFIQTDTPLLDYNPVAVYRSEKDGTIWVRPVDEFYEQDRFEQI